MSPVVVVAIAFIAMEPLAALAHRFVMHRGGFGWHRSHHLAAKPGFEENDRYPMVFAAVTIVVMALGTSLPALRALVWIGVGVTLYGCAYLLVHDVCIHGRFAGRPLGHRGYVGYVRAAHRIHHMGGAAPYGFLLPVARRSDRQRVAAIGRRSVDRTDAIGRPRLARPTKESLRASGTEARRVNTS